MSEVSVAQFSMANLLEIIGETALIAAISASKSSVAVFLLRIAVKRWHSAVLWFAMVSLAIMCFFCALLNYLQCFPIEHAWNVTIPAKCWMSVTPLAITTGGQHRLSQYFRILLTYPSVLRRNRLPPSSLAVEHSLYPQHEPQRAPQHCDVPQLRRLRRCMRHSP
jgi:hypothetical protein